MWTCIYVKHVFKFPKVFEFLTTTPTSANRRGSDQRFVNMQQMRFREDLNGERGRRGAINISLIIIQINLDVDLAVTSISFVRRSSASTSRQLALKRGSSTLPTLLETWLQREERGVARKIRLSWFFYLIWCKRYRYVSRDKGDITLNLCLSFKLLEHEKLQQFNFFHFTIFVLTSVRRLNIKFCLIPELEILNY